MDYCETNHAPRLQENQTGKILQRGMTSQKPAIPYLTSKIETHQSSAPPTESDKHLRFAYEQMGDCRPSRKKHNEAILCEAL